MIPAITEGGRSFKGAALYYLHDKRLAGETERLTTKRLAWSEAINLPTRDPDRAWRMMAHTAMSQADLKAAAGTKATGRKLTKPVFAYSLAWHEGDQPTEQEQRAAAHETLKALELTGHQALIVCHNDTKHPHVHVIVNRVDPATGIAAPLSKSKEKLQAWALAYQRQRGQEHCPKREENAKRKEQGQKKEQEPAKSRPAYEFEKESAGPAKIIHDIVAADQKQKDAQLYRLTAGMKERHSREWESAKADYAGIRAVISAETAVRLREMHEEVKTDMRPMWADLFKRQRIERQTFDARESGFLSRIFNMAVTFREMRRLDLVDLKNDLLGAIFAVTLGDERRNTLSIKHEKERAQLSAFAGKVIKKQTQLIRQKEKNRLDRVRDRYLGQCSELRATQAAEKTAMQGAWLTRNTERKQAMTSPAQGQQRERKQGQDIGRSISAHGYRRGGLRPR